MNVRLSSLPSLRSSSPLAGRVFLAALALASGAAAGTITVGPGGSIKAAIAAAAPGDTIHVLPGDYVDTGSLVIDKPLVLLGSGSAVTSFTAVASFPFDIPLPLHVTGLAAGEEVRVLGLTLKSSGSTAFQVGVAAVIDCAGPVVLADVRGSWNLGGTFGIPPGAVQVRNSARVSFTSCVFAGPSAPFSSTAAPGLACLYVENSDVSFNAGELTGGGGIGSFPSGGGASGGPGLLAVGSTVRLGRARVIGGRGGSGFFVGLEPGFAGDGAHALRAENSAIDLRGGPTNELQGGAGSLGSDVGSGASAVLLDAGSTLTTTPDALLAAGLDGDGGATAPTIDPSGSGAWTTLTERLATMRTTPAAATLGGPSTTEVAAEPFGFAVIGFSTAQGPALALPGVTGVVVLNLAFHGTLPTLALDPNGEAVLASTLPALPSMAGVTVVLQSVAVNPSGALSVSPPAAQGFLP